MYKTKLFAFWGEHQKFFLSGRNPPSSSFSSAISSQNFCNDHKDLSFSCCNSETEKDHLDWSSFET